MIRVRFAPPEVATTFGRIRCAGGQSAEMRLYPGDRQPVSLARWRCYPVAMDRGLEEQLDFLRSIGFATVEHDSHVPFLAHLAGVRRLLVAWGARTALVDAGLFHSVYGTEYFDAGLDDVSRGDVSAVIGAEAETIAWLWCTVRRDTIDAGTRTATDRNTGSAVDLTEQQVRDLAELWAADMVEQVERLKIAERNPWKRLDELVSLASAPAQAAYVAACERLGYQSTRMRQHPSS